MNLVAWYGGLGLITLGIILVPVIKEKIQYGHSSDRVTLGPFLARRPLLARMTVDWLVPALAGVTIVAFWPPILIYLGWMQIKEIRTPTNNYDKPFRVEHQDLVTKASLEQIEQSHHIEDPLGAVPDLPFGHLNPGWQKFRGKLGPKDEIWAFSSVYKTWGPQYRYEGYAAVRRNKVRSFFVIKRRIDNNQVTLTDE